MNSASVLKIVGSGLAYQEDISAITSDRWREKQLLNSLDGFETSEKAQRSYFRTCWNLGTGVLFLFFIYIVGHGICQFTSHLLMIYLGLNQVASSVTNLSKLRSCS